MIRVDGSSIPWQFDERRSAPPSSVRGKHCFVLTEGAVLDDAKQAFGRDGDLCLKVFFLPLEGSVEDYLWGRPRANQTVERAEELGNVSRLGEATTLQNLAWLYGLAPRVYGLLLVERGGRLFPAQLTDYARGAETDDLEGCKKRIATFVKGLGGEVARLGMLSCRDFLGVELIDWQGFRLRDTSALARFVRETGQFGKAHYQSVPELGLGAHPRNTAQRVREMGLERIDFAGKHVLDVGCALGQMCNYAAKRGAVRTLGLDKPDMVKAAYAVAFALGSHNNDYEAVDLATGRVEGQFDITFFLSMNLYIGFPEWIADQTELLIFEENAKGGKYRPDYWQDHLSQWFTVEHVTHTTDHNPRFPKPVFVCRKK